MCNAKYMYLQGKKRKETEAQAYFCITMETQQKKFEYPRSRLKKFQFIFCE